MTVEKPKPKQLLRPITTGTNSAMNQSQFLAITCNSSEAREKSRVHGAIGFGFACHSLKNSRESLKPITKRSNRNHVITFDSHLKIALNVKRPELSGWEARLMTTFASWLQKDQFPMSYCARTILHCAVQFVLVSFVVTSSLLRSRLPRGGALRVIPKTSCEGDC